MTMRHSLLMMAALLAACTRPGGVTPAPTMDVASLMRQSKMEPLDSETLRHVAARAHLPLPDRQLVVYVVQNATTFTCGPWGRYRCFGIYLGGTDGAADAIFITDAAPWPTMQHEFLHYLTHDGEHGPLFRQLGLDKLGM